MRSCEEDEQVELEEQEGFDNEAAEGFGAWSQGVKDRLSDQGESP